MALSKNSSLPLALGVITLLLFGGGLYYAISQSKKADEATSNAEATVKKIKSLAAGVEFGADSDILVQPTPENVQRLDDQIAALGSRIEEIKVSFATPEGYFDNDVDEFNFLPRVQGFVNQMRARFRSVPGLLPGGEVRLADEQEGFGFELYLGRAPTPAEGVREKVDLERQIMARLLAVLLRSYEGTLGGTLVEVRREVIGDEAEVDAGNRRRAGGTGVFTLNDLVTARLQGSVSTLGFELVFEGDTRVLRSFLNGVTQLPFPVRVASVQVERVEIPKEERRGKQDETDALAALFGGDTTAEPDDLGEPEVDQTPIVEDNLSRFSVILEYIEIEVNAADPEAIEAGAEDNGEGA